MILSVVAKVFNQTDLPIVTNMDFGLRLLEPAVT